MSPSISTLQPNPLKATSATDTDDSDKTTCENHAVIGVTSRDIVCPVTCEKKISVIAEDSRLLALVPRDCILQVFPRLFPSGRLRPAVR